VLVKLIFDNANQALAHLIAPSPANILGELIDASTSAMGAL
jgi:hypothetical protein